VTEAMIARRVDGVILHVRHLASRFHE
jgi:hypothetical protein